MIQKYYMPMAPGPDPCQRFQHQLSESSDTQHSQPQPPCELNNVAYQQQPPQPPVHQPALGAHHPYMGQAGPSPPQVPLYSTIGRAPSSSRLTEWQPTDDLGRSGGVGIASAVAASAASVLSSVGSQMSQLHQLQRHPVSCASLHYIIVEVQTQDTLFREIVSLTRDVCFCQGTL